MSPTDLFVALHVLGADIQQSDGRPEHAVRRTVKRLAHDGEFHQPLGVAVDVGADVQKGGHRPRGGDRGDQRRALQIGAHPQNQLGHRHQGAGVASRYRRDGLPLAQRLDGVPHRSALAASQRLGGFLVHTDDAVSVADLDPPGGNRVSRQGRGDGGLVAVQQEPHRARQSGDRADNRRDHHGRTVVAAHGVDRDYQRLGQGGALSYDGYRRIRGRR